MDQLVDNYGINSFTDLTELYAHFRVIDSYSIPLPSGFPFATLPNLAAPVNVTNSSKALDPRPNSYVPTLEYISIHDFRTVINDSRWLASAAAYPDGRFFLIDNRNQQFLLLNQNGTYRIDLTPIFFHQIKYLHRNASSTPSIARTYSFARVFIDQESYVYLVPTTAYQIYVFSQENRLVRCLTPRSLGMVLLRSDCVAVTHTGLIYVCDDAYRSIRIFTRMGVLQRTIRLDFLPLKLLISNTRLFSYSIEAIGRIHIYDLSGLSIRTVSMCSYKLPSEVVWFRGKYFLTCGTQLYVLDEQGELVAERNLQTLLDTSDNILTIHDFALNKQGQLLITVRRNGTLSNRYWVMRPADF
jgi:hypothetical protein